MKRSTRSCLAVPLFLGVITIAVVAVIVFWPMPKGEIYFRYKRIEVPGEVAIISRAMNEAGYVVGHGFFRESQPVNGYIWHTELGFIRLVSIPGFDQVLPTGITEDSTIYGQARLEGEEEGRPFIQTLSGEMILEPTQVDVFGYVIFLNNKLQAIIRSYPQSPVSPDVYIEWSMSSIPPPRYYSWEPNKELVEIAFDSSATGIYPMEFNDAGQILYHSDTVPPSYFIWSQDEGSRALVFPDNSPDVRLRGFHGENGYWGTASSEDEELVMTYSPESGWAKGPTVSGTPEGVDGVSWERNPQGLLSILIENRRARNWMRSIKVAAFVYDSIDWDYVYSCPQGTFNLSHHTEGLDDWKYAQLQSRNQSGAILVNFELGYSGVLVPTDAYREKFLKESP